MDLGCMIMAAGAGSRFGGNKLAAEVAGKPLYRRALEAVPRGLFRTVAVVTGKPEIAALAREMGFCPVCNDRPDLGVSRTIRLGLGEMAGCSGVVFMTADQPWLTGETLRKLAAAFRENPRSIVAAAACGVRGNPCFFPSDLFPALLALEGDVGGSRVIRAHPDRLVLVEVPALELADADTPEALEALGKP